MKRKIGGAEGDAVFQCQLNRSFQCFQVFIAACESCWSIKFQTNTRTCVFGR